MTEPQTLEAIRVTLNHMESQLNRAAEHRDLQTAALTDLRERMIRVEERQANIIEQEGRFRAAASDIEAQHAVQEDREVRSDNRRAGQAILIALTSLILSGLTAIGRFFSP